MSQSRQTRSDTHVWLIGQISEIMTCRSKLPSIGDVLRRLFWLTHNKKSVKEASNIIYSEIYDFWDRAKLPTKAKQDVLTKIRKTYEQYRSLLKLKSRRSQIQIEKETIFKESLNDLFDIAHANAMKIISNEEDRVFS